MLPAKISPSMMCVDYARFAETLRAFEAAGVELLHVDVMDGVFVKNYTLGTDFCRNLRKMRLLRRRFPDPAAAFSA